MIHPNFVKFISNKEGQEFNIYEKLFPLETFQFFKDLISFNDKQALKIFLNLMPFETFQYRKGSISHKDSHPQNIDS